MKYINKENGLELIIDEVLIKSLYESSLNHYPNEFGGLLTGNYSPDKKTVFINQSIQPIEYKSSRYSFNRGSRGLKSLLQKLFKMRTSQYYIGEWHSHPDGSATPSETDLRAFIQITSHNEVYIENPVLLILSVSKSSYDYNFYLFLKNNFLKYENKK